MLMRHFILLAMVPALGVLANACGSSDPAATGAPPADASGADSGADADAGAPDADASADSEASIPDADAEASPADSDSEDSGADALEADSPDPCAATGLASFKISNLPSGFQLPALNGTDPVIGPQGFDTDTGSFPHVSGSFATALAGSAADSPRVLYVTDFTLDAGSEFVVSGTRPLIIIASGTVKIAGTVRTPQTNTASGAGGFPSPVNPGNCGSGAGCPSMGLGPGGGGPGPQSGIGGGGAGYCGLGGLGSSGGGAKGVKYGSPEIIPLVGGSSGGSASYGNGPSGPGGGALQIVAGAAIVIEATGVITMAGAGGYAGATGAGSGGSILLEAPMITVNGALAANGGGGGGSGGSVSIGQWGGVTATPAVGGGPGGEKAGDGSGGVTLDGTNGQPSLYGTGGGGGAGRIRMNTLCGTVTVAASAVISPAQTTVCATVGTLSKP